MSVARSEIKKRVAEILKDADLESTSAKKVRKQLEEDLDTDLTSRKEEVNAIIQEVMDENEEESEEEEEEQQQQQQQQQQQSSDYEPEDSPPPSKKKKAPASKKRKSNDSDESFEDDDGSEEEWGASKSKAKPKAKKPAKSRKRKDSDDNSSDEDFKPTKAKRKSKGGGGGGTGFTKPLNLSADLAAIVGKDVAPRHEVVKLMWAYIKEKKLQDPRNKQFAICDEKLKKVIGESKFKCFGMAKYLKSHMS